MKSWRTTASGLFLAVGLMFTQFSHALDDDPNTKMSTEIVLGSLAAVGGALGVGWFSRDKNVSSEDQGVK